MFLKPLVSINKEAISKVNFSLLIKEILSQTNQ